VQISKSASIPPPIRELMLREPKAAENVPGLVIGTTVTNHTTALGRVLAELRRGAGLPSDPVLMVTPRETAAIFANDKEVLDLVKAIAAEIAGQVHPHLKIGLDVTWLVYDAARLWGEWRKPERNAKASLFKLAGLGLGAAKIAGTVYPDVTIPDRWANGLNVIVKGGGAVVQGKVFPTNELLLSADKRLAIPLKAVKVFGIALDPSPAHQGISAVPLASARYVIILTASVNGGAGPRGRSDARFEPADVRRSSHKTMTTFSTFQSTPWAKAAR
jgi:hypothetical protein